MEDEATVISEEVQFIGYVHADDGRAYVHHFEHPVRMEALPDGTVLISSTEDQPIWEDFE